MGVGLVPQGRIDNSHFLGLVKGQSAVLSSTSQHISVTTLYSGGSLCLSCFMRNTLWSYKNISNILNIFFLSYFYNIMKNSTTTINILNKFPKLVEELFVQILLLFSKLNFLKIFISLCYSLTMSSWVLLMAVNFFNNQLFVEYRGKSLNHTSRKG